MRIIKITVFVRRDAEHIDYNLIGECLCFGRILDTDVQFDSFFCLRVHCNVNVADVVDLQPWLHWTEVLSIDPMDIAIVLFTQRPQPIELIISLFEDLFGAVTVIVGDQALN